jgi:transposase
VSPRSEFDSEIGDIARFASPAKLCGYTGLCRKVKQSGNVDARGPISKHGPKYLRWAPPFRLGA